MAVTSASETWAQELEPRALTNLPIGTNFAFIGYGHISGNSLLDPSLPLEDFSARLNSITAGYARAISIFGVSGKVDAYVPFVGGDWTFLNEGAEDLDTSTGFGDLRVRLGVNFVGAPALKAAQFASYKQDVVIGAAVQVFVPTGTYHNTQLPNIGSNRWAFRNSIGVSKTFDRWVFEGYAAIWLFTDNTDFLEGKTLAQAPLFGLKLHGVRKLGGGKWLSLDLGYGAGARGTVNDVKKDNRINTIRFGCTLSIPFGRHSLKFSAASSLRIEKGNDLDAFAITYLVRW
ncbi:transporter [Bacteroidota bacterium]